MARTRGYILDLSTNQGQIFAINPESFEEAYASNWSDRGGLSAPHHRRQFKSTSNPTITMELVYNRKIIADLAKQLGTYDANTLLRAMKQSKSFFESLVSPRRHRGSILVQAPPPVLVVWPKVLRIRANVDRCSISNSDFDKDGALVEFMVSIELTEQRLKSLYSSDIRRLGSLRGGGQGG